MVRSAAVRVLAFATMMACGASLTPARAEYPDHNIDLIIPYGPGGGFDLYARAVAKEMEAQLPRGITIVPRNVPGAASIRIPIKPK